VNKLKIYYITKEGKQATEAADGSYNKIFEDDNGRIVRQENYHEFRLVSYTEATFEVLEGILYEHRKHYSIQKDKKDKMELVSIEHLQHPNGRCLWISNNFSPQGDYRGTYYTEFDDRGNTIREIKHVPYWQTPADIRYILDEKGNLISEKWYNPDGSLRKIL
jgi:hypothetical protein